ncbi:Site-specific recombinase XerD [Halomonas shengliensis]|uniref:Site-specific recombinase XerD n=1 Tax=Halomonas shengliensis TaxID=419597 RepID=A0A1H0LSI3_9GAMM|nr:phage integrase Arm DNA-binding domain-containing protein [Halomonas shengliensis]SDO71001.1 Site-specific recombinase XerD [Halomonas shengliensis]
MAARPRKRKHRGLEPNLYESAGYYTYRNPRTGKKHGMGSDKAKAQAAARVLNARLVKGTDLVARVEGTGGLTLGAAIEAFQRDRVDNATQLAAGTRRNKRYALARLAKDRGEMPLEQITTRWCAEYLDEHYKGEPYRYHRALLVQVFQYARTKGWMEDNPIEPTAKSDAGYTKQRRRLTPGQFQAIYEQAEPWFQIAMELALVCLFGRAEVAAARYDHIVDGRLRYIRKKTRTRSHSAYVAIEVTPAIEDIIQRSRLVPPVSPYIVHRVHQRITAETRARNHWSRVTDDMLSKTFARLRDKVPEIARLEPRQRPTFHEIRSLGSKLLEDSGADLGEIQVLMGHADESMTQHYLDGHGIRWQDAKGPGKGMAALLEGVS